MIGKKDLSEVRRELVELLGRLPNDGTESWIEREIQAADGQSDRDVETLKMVQSALRRSAQKKKKDRVPSQS